MSEDDPATDASQPPGALDGVRVLDLTRVLAGPYCTMMLADLGADVIKVERPGAGDDTREWGPPFAGGESAYYLCANRNKRSITIDIGAERGQEIVRRMAATCDVLVENFRTGTLDRLGLGYACLRALNRRIIHCSITGFGTSGPAASRPGYDFLVQAMSGLMSITGTTEPVKVGVALADVLAGQNAAIAILAALRHRDRTGEGQTIDIALMDSQLAALVNVASSFLVSGVLPSLSGNSHPNIVPYQAFACLDRTIVICAGNDRQFQAVCRFLDHPEWAEDPRFTTNPQRVRNRDSLVALMSQAIGSMSADECLIALDAAGVPAGPVRNLQEAFADPQVTARSIVVEVDAGEAGRIPMLRSPLRLGSTPPTIRRAPPHLGEHTREVLLEAGYDLDQIAELERDGVV